jgi:hypothetical protein
MSCHAKSESCPTECTSTRDRNSPLSELVSNAPSVCESVLSNDFFFERLNAVELEVMSVANFAAKEKFGLAYLTMLIDHDEFVPS